MYRLQAFLHSMIFCYGNPSKLTQRGYPSISLVEELAYLVLSRLFPTTATAGVQSMPGLECLLLLSGEQIRYWGLKTSFCSYQLSPIYLSSFSLSLALFPGILVVLSRGEQEKTILNILNS